MGLTSYKDSSRRGGRMVRVRGDEMIETEVRVVQKMDDVLKMRGDHEPRNAGTPQQPETARKQTLLKPPEGM